MGARFAVLAALALRACQTSASRDCGDARCSERESCCARTSNNSTAATSAAAASAARDFVSGAGWLARRLSGVLLLLLLFAAGYAVQRVLCPRPRVRREGARESRDTLLTPDSAWIEPPPPPPPPPRLPTYDELKHPPTYEESVQQQQQHRERENEGLGEGRSDENLLQETRRGARHTRSSTHSV